MRIRIGLGCLASFFLASCWLPLPAANITKVELVNVWDAQTSSSYEELNVTYELASVVSLSKVILKTEIYKNLEIVLDPFIYQNDYKNFEGVQKEIRFSAFESLLPRGHYTLTLLGKAGQEKAMIFYLDSPTFKGDWKNFVQVKSGELILSENVEWTPIDTGERTFYQGSRGSDILLIKGFPKGNEMGPPGLEPGTGGL